MAKSSSGDDVITPTTRRRGRGVAKLRTVTLVAGLWDVARKHSFNVLGENVELEVH